jgi:hypothetical protein
MFHLHSHHRAAPPPRDQPSTRDQPDAGNHRFPSRLASRRRAAPARGSGAIPREPRARR